jgi:hypothetical protein
MAAEIGGDFWRLLRSSKLPIDHPNRNKLPLQKMHDMSFVFSEAD